ncbi:hypothetical protein MLD38_008121 [Melastoma candidum]|uniref:Uncharacterized protein n=1 Tax=Melastoma candidum TaxID=119954 RepID=A0ACB9RTG6_9MYRT|nr:hypothetical protein MLD38_008121 [Melastoma candidum]
MPDSFAPGCEMSKGLIQFRLGFVFVLSEQGVMKTINVNKLTSAGCKVKIWIADWFAQLNNKMGGDLKKIQTVGQYLIEIWKAVGMELKDDKVEFLWSSEEINSRSHEYWPLVMDTARRNKLPRIIRQRDKFGVVFLPVVLLMGRHYGLHLAFIIHVKDVPRSWDVMSKMNLQRRRFSTHACNVPISSS